MSVAPWLLSNEVGTSRAILEGDLMVENLPYIDSVAEFRRFADMGTRDFPLTYEIWLKVINDRHAESMLYEGVTLKMIAVTAVGFARYCELRDEERNLKSLGRFVDEKASGTVFSLPG